MNASDFNVMPVYVTDDQCEIVITHRWTKKRWEWTGKMDDWPTARISLMKTIEDDLNSVLGKEAMH